MELVLVPQGGCHEKEGAEDSEWPVITSQDFQQMMAGMPQGEQQKLMVMLEEMQLKEQVTMYNSLVERCVCGCRSTFT
jgi:hypothetical protein